MPAGGVFLGGGVRGRFCLSGRCVRESLPGGFSSGPVITVGGRPPIDMPPPFLSLRKN